MVDYAQDALEAKEALKEDGQLLTINVLTNGSYDNETSTMPQVNVQTTGYGLIFDFQRGQTEVAGEPIKKTDRRVFLDADTELREQDQIEIIDTNSIKYKVIGIQRIDPAGIVVLYDLHIRK